MTPDRKSLAEMVSEWLREASVLITVFALLDKLLKNELIESWVWGTIATAGLVFAVGAALERYRRS